MEKQERYGGTMNAGRIEEEMKQLGRDMTVNALGALSGRGVLISERGRTDLQRRMYEFVTQSVELDAALAETLRIKKGER